MRRKTAPDTATPTPGATLAPRTRLRTLALAACATLAATALATAAHAQLPEGAGDPFAEGEKQVEDLGRGTGVELDTDYTPRPKDGSKIWQQIGGAKFAKATTPDAEQSVGITRYDDNLFAVSFRTPENGLVGGARCGNPDDTGDFEKSNPDSEQDCVPVLYRYADDPINGKPKAWEQVKLPGGVGDPNGNQSPGYIGAIAWIDADRALVVGGDGTYPRREPPFTQDGQDPGEPYGANKDQAGMARVWLLTIDGADERWCELKRGQGQGGCPTLPIDEPDTAQVEEMRGLTALDFYKPVDGTEQKELGFAGGLGQIWQWEASEQNPGGGFTKLYDNDSPQEELGQTESVGGFGTAARPAKLFHFRVRQLRFATQPLPRPHAYAVTGGCCSGRDISKPLVLSYSELSGKGKWTLTQASLETFSALARPGSAPESLPPSQAVQPGAGAPDSFYSVATGAVKNGSFFNVSYAALATQASEDSTLEQRSEIWCNGNRPTTSPGDSGILFGIAPPVLASLSTGRLLSLDGPGGGTSSCPSLDWAVGELRAKRAEGRGRRGVVSQPRTTERTPTLTDLPTATTCGNFLQFAPEAINEAAKCVAPQSTYAEGQAQNPHTPTDQGRLAARLASLDLQVDSYTLNALDMVGSTGTGYAVGDHGAILALEGAGSGADRAKAEPDPPNLGNGRPGTLSDLSPYASLRPAPPKDVPPVPPIAARPRERLPHPELFPWGSPDATHDAALDKTKTEDVSQIVMSRDGREGWAVGPHRQVEGRIEAQGFGSGSFNTVDLYGVASLYHYDGTGWRRCDPLGTPKQLEPDPACASVAGLREFKGSVGAAQKLQGKLIAAARIPLERDSDPANDDEFEVVAIGWIYRGKEQPADDDPVILRYKDGSWDFEERERRMAVSSWFSPELRQEPGMNPNDAGTQGNLVLKDVAFTAPDDGWILARQDGSGGFHRLFHFDGEKWEECVRVEGSCGSLRIPRIENEARLRLTSAGERVYLYGTRQVRASSQPLIFDVLGNTQVNLPMILYHERSGEWTDGSDEHGQDGAGYDPGCERMEDVNGKPTCVPETDAGQGRLYGLTVTQDEDGSYEGLAIGRFHPHQLPPDSQGMGPGSGDTAGSLPAPKAVLMRLERQGERYRWRTFTDDGALEDYIRPRLPGAPRHFPEQSLMALSAPPEGGPARVIVAPRFDGRLFSREPVGERFELARSELPTFKSTTEYQWWPKLQALAADGEGGAWVALKNSFSQGSWSQTGQLFFYHLTDRPPKAVFRESAHPFGDRDLQFTSLAGARDGTVWLGTNTGQIARYDRLTGWETVRIPGWDPGRVVTKESAVNAVAVNDSGQGVAVGERGRIADLAPDGVRLDEAAGKRCVDSPPPCGTSRELHAAAVAPDGSALAGGDALTLLWRPAGGQLQAATKPPGGDGVRITGISMPTPERAYLSTNSGYVYVGDQLGGANWSWRAESLSGRTVLGSERPLRAVAVNADGRGYAVGDKGVVLHRVGEGHQPWQRVRGPGTDDLTSVALPHGDGDSVLIGGRNGVVWTGRNGTLSLAKPGELFRLIDDDRPESGPVTGPVVGLALLPGAKEGQTEAWAAVQARGERTNRLYHYASDEREPLLNPDARTPALPDTPAKRDGELSFAAFGKSDCQDRPTRDCPELLGSGEQYEQVVRRIPEELAQRKQQGLDFSLHTGDASDSAGYPLIKTLGFDRELEPPIGAGVGTGGSAYLGRMKHRRFSEFVIDPLERSGLPVFGTPGAGDLSRPWYYCDGYGCGASPTEPAKTGESSAWREAMERRRGPWGRGKPAEGGALSFSETPGSRRGSQPLPDVEVDPDGDEGFVPKRELKGGARTHYAVEIARGEDKVARLIVVDTSLRSLSASDPIQNPIERSGQLQWLERMLCFEGQTPTGGGNCTREEGQQAIVLSNTPTYSYGPGAIDATQTDGVAMERLLLQYRASVVVSGRLGWNARYWATAPGVHEPCPGSGYQDTPPEPGARVCGRGQESLPGADRAPALTALSGTLGGTASPPEPVTDAQRGADETVNGQGATGLVPFVVAASAGGKFGPNGENQNSSASDGFFHGYTIVRTDPKGDPRGVVVEQRPILDWISLTAQEHVLRPGQRLRLRGVGREPIGFSASDQVPATRYATIDSPAITHRYDLLEADPSKPWLPRRSADGDYVPLPPDIGTIDPQTGQVKAGRGNHPRAFAIGMLSVGCSPQSEAQQTCSAGEPGVHAATWPLVFEPRRSFRPKPAQVLPSLPLPKVAASAAAAIQSPQAPPPINPPTPQVNLLVPPPIPGLPTPTATPPQPPAPPAPPPPPVSPQATPLDLVTSAVGLNVAPQATVIPPPAPPIQPAPPGGARREARQRQAATAKSEEGAQSAQEHGVDLAEGPATPDQTAMTRRDRTRPTPSITTITNTHQPSAWPRNLAYGGALTTAALILALGWTLGKPGPRRRQPQLPAPARSPTHCPPRA